MITTSKMMTTSKKRRHQKWRIPQKYPIKIKPAWRQACVKKSLHEDNLHYAGLHTALDIFRFAVFFFKHSQLKLLQYLHFIFIWNDYDISSYFHEKLCQIMIHFSMNSFIFLWTLKFHFIFSWTRACIVILPMSPQEGMGKGLVKPARHVSFPIV